MCQKKKDAGSELEKTSLRWHHNNVAFPKDYFGLLVIRKFWYHLLFPYAIDGLYADTERSLCGYFTWTRWMTNKIHCIIIKGFYECRDSTLSLKSINPMYRVFTTAYITKWICRNKVLRRKKLFRVSTVVKEEQKRTTHNNDFRLKSRIWMIQRATTVKMRREDEHFCSLLLFSFHNADSLFLLYAFISTHKTKCATKATDRDHILDGASITIITTIEEEQQTCKLVIIFIISIFLTTSVWAGKKGTMHSETCLVKYRSYFSGREFN